MVADLLDHRLSLQLHHLRLHHQQHRQHHRLGPQRFRRVQILEVADRSLHEGVEDQACPQGGDPLLSIVSVYRAAESRSGGGGAADREVAC